MSATVVVVALFFVALGALVAWILSSPPRPAPRGSSAVGSCLFDLNDVPGGQLFGERRGQPRRVSVRAYYPAAGQLGSRLTTMDGRVSQAFGRLYGFPSSAADGPESSSHIDAELEVGPPLPVVVFSHGGFSDAGQNHSLFEALASEGYLVFSLAHVGESVMTLYADGTQEAIDPSLENAIRVLSRPAPETAARFREALASLAQAESRARSEQAALELGVAYEEMFEPTGTPLRLLLESRVRDLECLVTALAKMNEDKQSRFFSRLDLSRLALIGHSLGGVAALRTALLGRLSPAAIVALDVPYMRLKDDASSQLDVPLLCLYAEKTPLPAGGVARTSGVNRYLSCSPDSLELTMRGAAHMNFADMNFLPRVLRFTPLLGSIDGGRADRLLSESVSRFLDTTLRGAPSDDLRSFIDRSEELERGKPCQSA